MGYMDFDEDAYETVSTYTPCRSCDGDLSKCNGRCTGSASFGLRRRSPEAIAAIKAERRRKHEDEVLAEAEAIRVRRAREEDGHA